MIKEGVNDTEKTQSSADKYFGFIAQEVEIIFPELVSTDEKGDKYISYMEFIPLLVEAIKEQQEEIVSLQAQLNILNQTPVLKSTSINNTTEVDHLGIKSELFQNKPNPFTEETIIEYYLKDNVISATMYIYDMNGKQLRSYELHLKSRGSVTISGGELDAGMYIYSLIADGKIIGLKQMVLTE